MGLEVFTFITSLVRTNPAGGDGINAGDDHIRGFKQAVQDSLPNVDAACTFTPTEINSWEARIAALEAVTNDYTKLSDKQVAGTQSGTMTAGLRIVRVLNTKEGDALGNVSLAANQFTLVAGTYRIKARAPSYLTSSDQLFLNNVTAVLPNYRVGSSGNFSGTSSVSGGARAALDDIFTIGAPTIFELTHECGVTHTVNGLGTAATFGEQEEYAVVELWKLA